MTASVRAFPRAPRPQAAGSELVQQFAAQVAKGAAPVGAFVIFVMPDDSRQCCAIGNAPLSAEMLALMTA
jgi:hypothetical protein